MAKHIIPRSAIVRGVLVHRVADVQFTQFRHAVSAWSAIHALQERHNATAASVRWNIGRADAIGGVP